MTKMWSPPGSAAWTVWLWWATYAESATPPAIATLKREDDARARKALISPGALPRKFGGNCEAQYDEHNDAQPIGSVRAAVQSRRGARGARASPSGLDQTRGPLSLPLWSSIRSELNCLWRDVYGEPYSHAASLSRAAARSAGEGAGRCITTSSSSRCSSTSTFFRSRRRSSSR